MFAVIKIVNIDVKTTITAIIYISYDCTYS